MRSMQLNIVKDQVIYLFLLLLSQYRSFQLEEHLWEI